KTPSPGLILHGYCIRRAIEDCFKSYDFLRGNEPYKYMFGVEERLISCTLFRTRNGQNLHGVLNPRSIRFVYEQALDMYRNGARSKA
ncbi:GNAT family N-acetyltransferase, partial [Rhizobium ruizarguesonis]